MSDKKTKVKCDCELAISGTKEANEKAVGDLIVPDPDPSTGKEILRKAMAEEPEDDDNTKNS